MKHAQWLIGGLLGFVLGAPALAFNVFPYGADQASKWGENTIGTPGGVVTWSLMADGTGLDAAAPTYIHGTSDMGSLFAQIDTAYGAGTALTALQKAFGQWSAVANISFVQVTETGSVPFAAAYAGVGASVIGNIRVGAYNLDGFSGAVGFAPAPNGGTTLEGDVIFNLNVAYAIPPGNEGDPYFLYPNPSPTLSPDHDSYYHNDFQGLFTHELGHAIGLAHTNVASALMCGYVDGSFDGSACAYNGPAPSDGMAPINRIPDADDVAGAQYLYGAAAPVPEPESFAMLLAGLGVIAGVIRRRRARPEIR